MERPGFVLKEEVSVMFSGFFKTEKKKKAQCLLETPVRFYYFSTESLLCSV